VQTVQTLVSVFFQFTAFYTIKLLAQDEPHSGATADIWIIECSLQLYISMLRDHEKGTWFIQSLVEGKAILCNNFREPFCGAGALSFGSGTVSSVRQV
jgi:hypothetical protein